jgi:hypothetical protein
MKLFASKIDRLSKKHQKLTALRENKLRAMKERNSRRENKSQEYLNRATKDYEDTQRVVTNIDHKIDKVIRDMGSEKIYVESVTNQETKEYLANQAARTPTNLVSKTKLEPKESIKTENKTRKETK